MNNGWRSRFLAPGYALVISLVLVAILGFAQDDPLLIQFTVPGPAGGPKQQAKELQGRTVGLKAADSDTLLAEEQLGPSGEVTALNPHTKIRICTMLPAGWSPRTRDVSKPPEESCWPFDATDKDIIEIELNRSEPRPP